MKPMTVHIQNSWTGGASSLCGLHHSKAMYPGKPWFYPSLDAQHYQVCAKCAAIAKAKG